MSEVEGERCYQCGRTVQSDDASCPACGAVQMTVCEECYATVSVYADACVRCGAYLLSKEYSPSKTPWLIAGAVIVAVALACGLAFAIMRDPERKLREAFEEATTDYHDGRYEDALRKFTALKGEYPKQWQVHLRLGQVHARLGQLKAAAVELDAALREEPGHPRAQIELAAVQYEQGQYEEALRWR